MGEFKAVAYGRTRVNLSLHHLLAACRSTARVRAIEHEHAGLPLSDFWDEILHHSLGVATLTIAALESYANELYFEGGAIAPFINATGAAECLELIDNRPVLRKYSLVLALRSNKRLDHSATRVQNIEALVQLRNAVVHFRPEWFDAPEQHAKLSKRLQYRFSGSPFLPNEALFPRAWASSSFADWAIKSTLDFLEYFFTEAQLVNPVAQFLPRINALAGHSAP